MSNTVFDLISLKNQSTHSPLSQDSKMFWKNLFFFAHFKVTVQIFWSEVLELGSYNNLAKLGKCQTFFQNHSTLLCSGFLKIKIDLKILWSMINFEQIAYNIFLLKKTIHNLKDG